MEYCWLHEILCLLQTDQRRGTWGTSFFGGTDEGCGGVRVGAEQSSNGVVALARVICCEHHLRENTDRIRFQQSPTWIRDKGTTGSHAEVIIFSLLLGFSEQLEQKADIQICLQANHWSLVQFLEQVLFSTA